jgi:hypothetical protein
MLADRPLRDRANGARRDKGAIKMMRTEGEESGGGEMRGRPGRYNVQPPMSLTRPEVMRGPRFTSTGPRAGTPAPRLIRFPVGPATLWRRVQSVRNGFGGSLSKFGPLDEEDAVPMVRKADAREMRWRPSRYTVQPPMSLSRPEVMRGPRFTSTGPVQEPPPPRLIGFPVGPAVLWASAEPVRWVQGAFKFRPLDFGPR